MSPHSRQTGTRTELSAHLALVTKRADPLLGEDTLRAVRQAAERACSALDTDIVEFDGRPDHVRLRIEYPPSVAISTLASRVRAATAACALASLRAQGREAGYGFELWAPSYFASTAEQVPDEAIADFVARRGGSDHLRPMG